MMGSVVTRPVASTARNASGDAERRARGPSALIAKAPPNVRFVGYLHDQDYWNEIGAADVVVALTTYPHSLLAAGQDAMAVGRPLVTSDKPVLREYFGDAALYVSDDGADLARGIRTALRDSDALTAGMLCRRSKRLDEWLRAFSEVRAVFERAERAAAPR